MIETNDEINPLPLIIFDTKKYKHYYYCTVGDERVCEANLNFIEFKAETRLELINKLDDLIEQLQEEVLISANDEAIPMETKRSWAEPGSGCIVTYGEALFANGMCGLRFLFWPKKSENFDTKKCKFCTIFYNYPKKMLFHNWKYILQKFGSDSVFYRNGLTLNYAEIEQRKLKPLLYCLHFKSFIELLR